MPDHAGTVLRDMALHARDRIDQVNVLLCGHSTCSESDEEGEEAVSVLRPCALEPERDGPIPAIYMGPLRVGVNFPQSRAWQMVSLVSAGWSVCLRLASGGLVKLIGCLKPP